MRIVTTLILALSFAMAQGQNAEVPQPMKDISFLEGAWSVENYENKKDEGWKSIGTTKADFTLEHDGRFIREGVKYMTSFGEINMITHIGFDNRINSYKLSAMDKEYGQMDIYHGNLTDGNLVFTNIESDKPILMEDGKMLSFRLSYLDLGDETFTHLVEGTFDAGTTWFSFSKSVYTKLKD